MKVSLARARRPLHLLVCSSVGLGLTTLAACRSPDAGSSSGGTDTDADTDANELPPAPVLSSPVDGAEEISLQTQLCWEPVEDPDGDDVAYRVYVDDMKLSDGILGDEGYPGPCVGPLLFVAERSYQWRVEAFEVEEPERTGPSSDTWTFSTLDESASFPVFEDDFEGEFEWDVSGDAGSGAWVHGNPTHTELAELSAQPGTCARGDGCVFTGHNAGGVPNDADVQGTTVLTSPTFDLGAAAAASVRLERFFFDEGIADGPELRVELLVPNPDAPGEDEVFLLERLDDPTPTRSDNAWTPREYAACDLPMRDNSRLRITAADPSDGVVEAAVDHVVVRGYASANLCGAGEGVFCDPVSEASPCEAERDCCSQGVINEGVYRCQTPVAGIDFDAPPENPDDPGNGTLGCDAPDLVLNPGLAEPLFTDIEVSGDTCELAEGCVGGVGMRRLMLFSAAVPNIGSSDLAMGVPANHPDLYHYSPCHDHYHFDEFARYELRDGDTVVATGHKQAFCMLDSHSFAWPFELPKFDCANQGISRGFTDVYEAGLPCQWVDVTGVAPGDYMLRVDLNPPRADHALPVLNERDYDNNGYEIPVTVQ